MAAIVRRCYHPTRLRYNNSTQVSGMLLELGNATTLFLLTMSTSLHVLSLQLWLDMRTALDMRADLERVGQS
jgi:hypothetical protein